MKELIKLRDILMDSVKELDTMKTGHLKMGELEAIKYIASGIDHINNIEMCEEDKNYSGAGNWSAEMRGNYGRGMSSARDSRGHYSRENRRYGGNDYSMDDGYSGDGDYSGRSRHYVRGHYSYADAKNIIMEHLDKAMDAAQSDKEREVISRAIKSIEIS